VIADRNRQVVRPTAARSGLSRDEVAQPPSLRTHPDASEGHTPWTLFRLAVRPTRLAAHRARH
jgi:hypothetical protein